MIKKILQKVLRIFNLEESIFVVEGEINGFKYVIKNKSKSFFKRMLS